VIDTSKIDGVKKRAFLAAYASLGNVTKAAEASGTCRQAHYDNLQNDPVYAEVFSAAHDAAADLLEAEARRRAVEGTTKPVFYKGEECGGIQEYSDTLLMFLLKGVRPEKYRDNVQVDNRYPDGVPSTNVTIVNYANDAAAREARINELITKRGAGISATP
jgi:hypothetical protein